MVEKQLEPFPCLTARFYGYNDTFTVGLYCCFSFSSLSDDWQFVRPSSVYFLGHVMSIEASIIQAHHTTLHVYVDSCVDTLAPEPRYSFIENHGCVSGACVFPFQLTVLLYIVNVNSTLFLFHPIRCLTDARHTGSKSHFLQQTQDDKL